jgi:hypothetical protein
MLPPVVLCRVTAGGARCRCARPRPPLCGLCPHGGADVGWLGAESCGVVQQDVGALAGGHSSLATIIVVAQVYFACPRRRTADGMVARITSAKQLTRAGTATCGGSGIACCTWRRRLSLGIFPLPSKPCAALWRKRSRGVVRLAKPHLGTSCPGVIMAPGKSRYSGC